MKEDPSNEVGVVTNGELIAQRYRELTMETNECQNNRFINY
jgi:hypothetical protein